MMREIFFILRAIVEALMRPVPISETEIANMKKTVVPVSQHFTVNPFLGALYRFFPKFPGYWFLLMTLGKVMPVNLFFGRATIRMNHRLLDIPIDLRDPYEIDVYSKNKSELCVPAVISELVAPDGCYVDVGANCGWYVRILSKAMSNEGLIVALEPSRRAFQFLSRLSLPNLMSLRLAISDKAGILEDRSKFFTQSSGTRFLPCSSPADYAMSHRQILSTTLDNLFANIARKPSLIKIDVEGAELLVLRGGLNLLKHVKHLLIEVNSDGQCSKHGYSYQDIYTLLERYGFVWQYDVRNSDNTIRPLAPHEKITGDILFSKDEIDIPNLFRETLQNSTFASS